MRSIWTRVPVFAVTAAALLFAGCAKKVAKVTPLPPPPPSAPAASLVANPTLIHLGQSAILTWQTQNADDVTIEGVGTVSASGTQTVSPTRSTTYTLMAKGPGGTKDVSARVTVNAVVSHAPTPAPSEADLFAKQVRDVYFNFDKADIRPDEVAAVSGDAAFLQQHPDIIILVEGHCDDRGSEDYNIALGQSRARTLKENLQRSGIDGARIKTISYGKEKPFCTAEDEQCWQENRRDHVLLER